MASTKRSSKPTPNDFGGGDYRGPAGLARIAVEDGTTIVYFFQTHWRGDLLAWSVTFSETAPAALKEAALSEARRLADAKP